MDKYTWNRKELNGWLEPGEYFIANMEIEGRKQTAYRSEFMNQIIGTRSDGKYFYLNVHASRNSTTAEREAILSQHLLLFDAFLNDQAMPLTK